MTRATVPTGAQLQEMAERFRFPAGVGDALVEDLDRCHRDEAAIADIAATQARLVDTPPLDLAMFDWGPSPTPLARGVAVAGLIPQAEDRYRARRIPDDVIEATLWDVGQQIDVHRRIHGTWGLSETSWLAHHVQARIVGLGRLQFALDTHWFAPDPALRLRMGDPVLGVHIPDAGSFPPDSCDDSFAAVEPFFAQHYPDHDWRGFTCVSWLLDPALRDGLDRRSNIVAFQDRFTHSPDFTLESDDAVVFTFRTTERDPAHLPTRTSLERTVVERLRAGHRWTVRAGSIDRETEPRLSRAVAVASLPAAERRANPAGWLRSARSADGE